MRPSIDACIDPVAWVSSLAGSPALSSVGLSARQCCERRAPYARRGGKGASCSGAMIEQVRPRAAYDTIGRLRQCPTARPLHRARSWAALGESSNVINIGAGSGSRRLRWNS